MSWGRRIWCSPSTEAYWTAQSKFSDSVVIPVTGTLGVSRVTVNYSRSTPSGTQEDLVSFNLHMGIAVSTNFAYLSDSQKADAEGDLDTFCSTLETVMSSAFTRADYVWHDWQDPDVFYGPADRVTPHASSTGALAAQRLPDQLAQNITMRTASRRHWGRIYIPGMGATRYETTYGRIVNGQCDTLASAFRTLYNNLLSNTAATEIGVFSLGYRGVLEIDEVHCDNVPDIIRRRRAKQPSYRKVFTS